MVEKNIKQELWNYDIEFDGDEPADINTVQAACLIRDILFTLEVPSDKVTITKTITGVYEFEEGGCSIVFMGEEPEYWHAEADLEKKTVDIQIDQYKMTIPLTTILMWFKSTEKSNL